MLTYIFCNTSFVTHSLLRHIFLLCVMFLIASTNTFGQQDACKKILPIYEEISDLTNKEFKLQVPCSVKNKTHIHDFIVESMKVRAPENKYQQEEKLLKLLGVLPKNMDYVKTLVHLYDDQVAGFYDPFTKSYTIADWVPDSLHTSVASHELIHVLQDQYYDLLALTRKDMTTDQSLSRAAIIEGDATFLMHEIIYKRNNKSILDLQSIEPIFQHIISQSKNNKNKLPRLIKDMIIFPYAYGLSYVYNQKKESTQNVLFEDYFKSPPNTTTEIIYSKDVLTNFNPQYKSCPLFPDHTLSYTDSMGEYFYISMIAPELLKNTQKRNWNGDTYCAYTHASGRTKILIYLEWINKDTFANVVRFFNTIKNQRADIKLHHSFPSIQLEYSE